MMGALLSICFKSRGDETQARNQCQQRSKKHGKMTKQMSTCNVPKQHLLIDSGRSPSGGYSSTDTGPPPTALERRPSWGKRPQSPHNPDQRAGQQPNPYHNQPAHPKQRDATGSLARTISFKLQRTPEASPSLKRKTFKKSGKRK